MRRPETKKPKRTCLKGGRDNVRRCVSNIFHPAADANVGTQCTYYDVGSDNRLINLGDDAGPRVETIELDGMDW